MHHLNRYLNPDYQVGFHSFEAFDQLVARVFNDSTYSASRHFSIEESADAYTLTLELPGFKQDEVDVTLERSLLTVIAKKEGRAYEQDVTIPGGVDSTKIVAALEDGVLSITLPKSEIAKPRKIALKKA
jgi:HSP20 family protein